MKRALLVLAPLALILQAGSSWAQGGTGSFNTNINWQNSPDLYYNVNGAPASVCGDLYANRNGAGYTVTYGWICTDGSGNATKGPWTWANQSGDEDAYVYIVWPGGSGTNTAHHIWDKTAPSVTINSFGSTPPTSFSGTGDDGSYGAGFSANFGSDAGVVYPTASECRVKFQDTTTGLYWCPGYSTSYDTSVACTGSCTFSGMPSRSVTWSADQVPPTTIYNSMHSYQWSVVIYDNSNLGQRTEVSATF
jgi:hypothetical protein